jgi:hypothetical protein
LWGRLHGCYRLTFQGEAAADASSLAELIGRTHELFLSWEHPATGFLAYRAGRFYGKVLRGMTDNGVSFRSLHTLFAKNQRKGRTLRADLLSGMGEAGQRLLEWPAEGSARP